MGVIKDLMKKFKKNNKNNVKIDNMSENERKYGVVSARLIEASEKMMEHREEYAKKAPQNLSIDKNVLDAIKKRRNARGGYCFVEERKPYNNDLKDNAQNNRRYNDSTVNNQLNNRVNDISYQEYKNNKTDSPISKDAPDLKKWLDEQYHEMNHHSDAFINTDAERQSYTDSSYTHSSYTQASTYEDKNY